MFSFMETLLKVFSKTASLENNNKKEARGIIAKQNPQGHFYLPSNAHKNLINLKLHSHILYSLKLLISIKKKNPSTVDLVINF